MSEKKYTIVNWVDSGKRLKELGFVPDDEAPTNWKAPKYSVLETFDMWRMATFLYDAGLNVMLYHRPNGETMIAVDSKRFQQR